MTRRVLLVIAALAAVTIACGDAAQVPSSPVRLGSPLVMDASTPTPRPTSTPVANNDPPAPSPTQPAAPGEWSKAERIAKGSCFGITAAIDEAGTAHIAATCGSGITYVTGRDGEWIADRLAAPEGYDERGPQLALDGGHLTLGYSRYAEEDGACGGSRYIDGGVFVRSRSLPDGNGRSRRGSASGRTTWRRCGCGAPPCTRSRSGTTERWSMSCALATPSGASLLEIPSSPCRSGSGTTDRLASLRRVATRSATAGSRVTASPGSGSPGPRMPMIPCWFSAAVVRRTWSGRAIPRVGGCAAAERDDRDGTYYATNAAGSWDVDRISKSVGHTSFTVDPSSGRVHLVIFDDRARYFTTSGDGDWTSTRIPATSAYDVVIRQDPASARLLVAYAVLDEDAEPGGIFALTRD